MSALGIFKRSKKDKARDAGADTEELKTRLDLLYDVALRASSPSEISQLIEQILSSIQHRVNGSASALLLLDDDRSALCFQAVEGATGYRLRHTRLDIDRGIAGWVARNKKPLMVNDVPGDRRFQQDTDNPVHTGARSVIAAPLIKGRKIIGVLEVANKTGEAKFDERDLAILSGFASTEALILLVSMVHTATSNVKVHETGLKGYKKTLETLAQAADAKDNYGLGHSQRVRDYTMLAARSLPLAPEEVQAIELGALLHDIGKIGISEDILCKSGPLTDTEWAVMKTHPTIGFEMIGQIPFVEDAKYVVLHHHERYDGKGYPRGLKKDNIPIGARLVGVADAFDTMTTDHSYRSALPLEDAIEELIAGKGSQFCPAAVEAFVSAFKGESASRTEKTEPDNKEADTAAGPSAGQPKKGRPHKEKAPKKAEGAESGELFEGEVTLAVTSPVEPAQVRKLQNCLRQVPDLKLVMSGWSEEEGNEIIVSTSKPLPLVDILREKPPVAEAARKRNKIQVTLKPG